MEIDLSAFDRTKPILLKKPVPDFSKDRHPELAKKKYYENDDMIYREGLGEYIDCCGARVRMIPGSLYFAVQNVPIINRQNGRLIDYQARDADLVMHLHARETLLKKNIGLTIKARGDGFSTMYAGVMPMYTWRILPGSTVAMTSSSSTTSSKLYNDKLKPALKNCPKEIFNYDLIKDGGDKIKEQTTGNINVKFRSSYIDEEGNLKELESSLYCRETSQKVDSASAFAGSGSSYIFIDEAPLHIRLDALRNSAINILQDTNTGLLAGLFMIGGVVEDTVSAKDLQKLFELWDKAEEKNINRLFLRSSLGKYVNQNGWSDEEKYMEFYETTLERLDKLEDPTDARAFRKNNPIKIGDVWDFATNQDFEPDVLELLKEQILRVRQNPPMVKYGRILTLPDKNNVDHMVFKEEKGAPFFILEEPKEGIIYNATLDATATGSRVSQEIGSKASALIIKGLDPENPKTSYRVVGGYYERPTSVNNSYRNTFLLIDYFNIHSGFNKLSAEANSATSEHLYEYMKDKGLTKYVAWCKGKPFAYASGDYRATQFLRANNFLLKYARHIDYLPLLEQMVSLVSLGKKDMMASWLMWFFLMRLDMDKPANDKPVVEMREQLRYNEQTKRMERVWIPVQVQTNTPSHQISNY